MGMKLPALFGLFHNLITRCSLQLLNVQLQAFACDTSLNHNYNNYVPMKRSTKMTSAMTWEGGGVSTSLTEGQGRNDFQMPKENISWACLGKTLNAFQEVSGFWGRSRFSNPEAQVTGHLNNRMAIHTHLKTSRLGRKHQRLQRLGHGSGAQTSHCGEHAEAWG